MKDFYEWLNPEMNQVIQFGQQKHAGQVRKFSGQPYFTHPSQVAEIVKQFSKDPEIIAAAYLHDTLEDTETTYDEIAVSFSTRVADLVQELTSVKEDSQKLGKAVYLSQKLNQMSPEALLIKLADRLDNVSDLGTTSESFSEKYKKETRYILENLRRPLDASHSAIIKQIWDKL